MTAAATRPTVSPRTFATVLGACAVLAGLLLLFLPQSVSVNDNAIRCGSAAIGSEHDVRGSAFKTSLAAIDQGDKIAPIDQAEAACASARHGRADLAWVLLGAGVVVVAGTRFVRWSGGAA